MATKKVQVQETNGLLQVGRKVVLAYVGMFGIAGDKLNEWFDLFVERGQVMEKDARKLVKREEKHARKLAADLQKQEKLAVKKSPEIRQTRRQKSRSDGLKSVCNRRFCQRRSARLLVAGWLCMLRGESRAATALGLSLWRGDARRVPPPCQAICKSYPTRYRRAV